MRVKRGFIVVEVSSEIMRGLQRNVKGDFVVTQMRVGFIPRKASGKKIANFFNRLKKRRKIILVRADNTQSRGQYSLVAFDAKTQEFMGIRPVIECERIHSLDAPTVPDEFKNKGIMSVLTAEAIKNASKAKTEVITTPHLSNLEWAEHLVKYLGGIKNEYGECRVFWSEKELQDKKAKWRYFLLQEKPLDRKPTPEEKISRTVKSIFKKTISAVK